MPIDTSAPELGDLINDAFAASDLNREMNALIAALAKLGDRLTAFAERDAVPELVAALMGLGLNRDEAAEGVRELMESCDSPGIAQDAARALAWTVGVVLTEFRSVALRPPGSRGRTWVAPANDPDRKYPRT
jgi:hypothetical protein